MIDIIFRTAIAWLGLTILLRLSGRRTLGEMSAVDLVVLLITGDMIQQSLLGDDASLTSGFVVIITLLTLTMAYAKAKAVWPGAARHFEGVPTVLIRNGKPDERQMANSRVAMDEILEAARLQGITEPEEIRFALLEVSGQISIIPRAPAGRA
ncbi:DUF421 domain-containing protein [Muricoccus aerilatus]|uniref:DUF421 domain-containing protein n=1 Tax=Muricoccus aerilatus TaxID=452982 RepID=UPI000693E57D|nr:YetF domain-containing protein [Roseomonas aerilata]